MTHRSPLATLAGLVVGFAIMFGLNVANRAPKGSYAEPGPSASATTAVTPATDQSSPLPSPSATDQPTITASPTTTPRAEPQFAHRVVYAGRTKDGSAAVAVAVLGGQAAGYFCDGRNVESWLRGTARDGRLILQAKNGERLEADLGGSRIEGSIRVRSKAFAFRIGEAKRPAGLYRARGSKTTIGWIVLPNGSQVGIQTNASGSKAAPRLNPNAPSVTAGGQDLAARPVQGDDDL